MGFPGTWMTESESMVYRVVPKCACSSIGQIMYYSDHGEFFDGDIHDATGKMHKWAIEASQPKIEKNVTKHKSYAFTCVRNPYGRILSSFFDKICGIQRNGKRYRGNLVPLLIQKYGIEVGDPETGFEFDQIQSFRRFLLFARDTIRWKRPMDPDIHWSAMSGHISTFIVNGGTYDNIFYTETFNGWATARQTGLALSSDQTAQKRARLCCLWFRHRCKLRQRRGLLFAHRAGVTFGLWRGLRRFAGVTCRGRRGLSRHRHVGLIGRLFFQKLLNRLLEQVLGLEERSQIGLWAGPDVRDHLGRRRTAHAAAGLQIMAIAQPPQEGPGEQIPCPRGIDDLHRRGWDVPTIRARQDINGSLQGKSNPHRRIGPRRCHRGQGTRSHPGRCSSCARHRG